MRVCSLLSILHLLALLVLSGCVGAVQDSLPPQTQIVAEPKSSIQFLGVQQARAISQHKIEIFFYPATGGSEKYNYIIYVGDRALPYSVPSEVLTPDWRGFLKFTATGLEPAKTYIIKVEAIDQSTGGKDDNTELKSVTTFSNLVADFSGISSVSNTSGTDGLDSIEVRWPHASIDYGNVTGKALTDPKTYQVVAVDADLLTPGDMANDLLGPAQGRYVKDVDYKPTVNSVIMRGLKSNTKYHVWVRCIHHGTAVDRNNPNLRSELNTNYLSIKTLNGDLSSIDFNPNSLVVTKNTGFAQTTSMLLSWPKVSGVFDHLRVFYQDSSYGPPVVTTGAECKVMPDSQTSCKKLLPASLDTTIPNLLPNKTYNFQLVVCQDVECTSNIVGGQKQGNTNPQMAGFLGIDSIDPATSISELGKLKLKYSLPDFSKGDFDGFVIGFASNTDFSSYTKITSPSYNGSMTIEDFNFRTDNTIIINNVDYLDGGLKCFTIYPFVWDGITQIEYPNDVWKCLVPEVSAPRELEFQGVISASTSGTSLQLVWDSPTKGIYDSFELYVRKTAGTFSFSQAITETSAGNFTNYSRYLLPWYITSYTINNLPLFSAYKVGVITYYVYGVDDIYRSEFNAGIRTCNVDAQVNEFGNFVSKDCVAD